jgi:hypothetical protein
VVAWLCSSTLWEITHWEHYSPALAAVEPVCKPAAIPGYLVGAPDDVRKSISVGVEERVEESKLLLASGEAGLVCRNEET